MIKAKLHGTSVTRRTFYVLSPGTYVLMIRLLSGRVRQL